MTAPATARWPRRRLGVAVAGAALATALVAGGPVGSTPGAPGSDRTAAGSIVPATTFDDAPIGDGQGTTGGGDGPVVAVTSLAPNGPGTLRELAAGTDARTVVFAVSGTIRLESEIVVGSNVTIDGRGAAIDIVGAGLELDGSQNVIIRNLRIHDGPDDDSNADALAVLNGSRNVWIDHVSLSEFPDGLLDVTQGSTDVTLSWNHLHDHGKAMLLGDANRSGAADLVDITVHHNFYEHTGERNPLMRHGQITVMNNVLRNWGYDADSGYGMRSDCGGHAWIENNEFDAGDNSRTIRYIDSDRCDADRPPAAVIRGNRLDDSRFPGELHTELVPEPTDIEAEPLTDAMVDAVVGNAGWQDVPAVVDIPDVEVTPTTEDPSTATTATSTDDEPTTTTDDTTTEGDDGGSSSSGWLAVAGAVVLIGGGSAAVWAGVRRRNQHRRHRR